jgi:hypothetical protein
MVIIVVGVVGVGADIAIVTGTVEHRVGLPVSPGTACANRQGNLAIVVIGRKRRFGVAGISMNSYFL